MPLSSRILRMAKKKAQETGTSYPLILELILRQLLHGFTLNEVEGLFKSHDKTFILEELVKEAMYGYS